jgi:hypothetical protein
MVIFQSNSGRAHQFVPAKYAVKLKHSPCHYLIEVQKEEKRELGHTLYSSSNLFLFFFIVAVIKSLSISKGRGSRMIPLIYSKPLSWFNKREAIRGGKEKDQNKLIIP